MTCYLDPKKQSLTSHTIKQFDLFPEEVRATKQVLIVDDEDIIREVVQSCLEDFAGWETLTASSGWEGLVKAIEDLPDAIVLDVMMPGMDGMKFLERLKAHPDLRSIPVVLLTAKLELIDSQQLSSLGIAGAIAKPFDPLVLSEQIASALGWSINKY
jgi:CheY-like chemotaxis protein